MRPIAVNALRFIWLVIGLFACEGLASQDMDTTALPRPDTTLSADTLLTKPSPGRSTFDLDSVLIESTSRTPRRPGRPAQSSQAGVVYGSVDSNYMDIRNNTVHLMGKAYIRYEDFEIRADYIQYNFSTNEVEAYSRGKIADRPLFKTNEQEIIADRIRFNVDTQQGIVEGARVVQDNMYIHGAVTKFVKAASDSLLVDDVIFNKNALITTCNHPDPHWGIRTSKLKLIPEKLAVIGPFNMELAGLPTPLMLPFAFAPLFNFAQGTSGLIFPQDPFYSSPNLGIGIRGLGYYFRFSDYFDLGLTADVYTRGSWGINAASNYRKRYKYNGSMNIGFSRQITEVQGQILPNVQNSYSINLTHNQDAKAHPYRRIGGNLRFTVNDFDRRNFTDAESQLNSQINSNFSYQYRLSKALSFSSGISHSQNTLNRSISFTVPTLQLRLNRVFPFKKPGGSSKEKWYEKINLQYNGQFQNSVNTVDTLLFTSQTLDLFRAGVTHEVSAGASYNLLRHFNFNTSIDYDEFWYLQTYEETADTAFIRQDFKPYRDIAVTGGLTTNLFGTILFKKGLIRGLRHEISPSVALSYSPATDRYLKFYDPDPDNPDNEEESYNPFTAESGERLFRNTRLDVGGASITYGLRNRLRGKYWSKKDSTEKKFEMLNANFSGSYNFNADSLKFSPISFSATSRILGGMTTLQLSGSLDAYATDASGRRINQSLWSKEKKLLRLVSLTGSINTSLTLSQIRDILQGKSTFSGGQGSRSYGRSTSSSRKTEYPELFSWFEGVRIDYNYRFTIRELSGKKEFQTSANSIRLTIRNIPLSQKWGVGVGNLSYDFSSKRWVYPSYNITRDLHCWEMNFSWQPALDTFSFFIGVSARPFGDFIKYQTGRTRFDASFR